MTFDEVVAKFRGPAIKSGKGVNVFCPIHKGGQEAHQSLHIEQGEAGRIIVACHCGAPFKDIISAVGLKPSDMFPETIPSITIPHQKPVPIEAFEYINYSDQRVRKIRYEPGFTPGRRKDFAFEHESEKGWGKGEGSAKLRLYHFDILAKTQDVIITEGERKADFWMETIGAPAVSGPYGAPISEGKWLPQYTTELAGKIIFLNMDEDEKGRAATEYLKSVLRPVAKKVYIIKNPTGCNDIIDAKNRWEAENINAVDKLTDLRLLAPDAYEPFPKITLRDLEDYVPDPSDFILGDGWLKRGNGSLFTGGTGLGKSVMTMQIAACVASGTPFFGMKIAHPFRVLYAQVENDMDCLKRDLTSIVRNINLDAFEIQKNLDIRCVYGLNGDSLAKWLEEHTKDVDLVLLDPYQCFVAVDDLNSTQAALSWINTINPILRAHRFSLMLVAHPPKPKDRQQWTERESVYMAMGSSILPNWARTSAELTEVGQTMPGVFRFRFGKNAERTGLINEHGGLIRDLFLKHSSSSQEPFWQLAEEQVKDTRTPEQRVAEELLETPHLSIRQLADITKISKSTVERIVRKINAEKSSNIYQ